MVNILLFYYFKRNGMTYHKKGKVRGKISKEEESYHKIIILCGKIIKNKNPRFDRAIPKVQEGFQEPLIHQKTPIISLLLNTIFEIRFPFYSVISHLLSVLDKYLLYSS